MKIVTPTTENLAPDNSHRMREIVSPPDPSPKIKIIHRPSIFEGSIDILSSDGKNTQVNGLTKLNLQSFQIPDSIGSSFADYESYVAFLHL